MPGQISDEDKYWFLKNCKAVLFPSKFEGMGIPPIEAMRFGKPVFASASSSIPEICEDNAFYWENFNPEDMKKSIKKFLALDFDMKIYTGHGNPTTIKVEQSRVGNWLNYI